MSTTDPVTVPPISEILKDIEGSNDFSKFSIFWFILGLFGFVFSVWGLLTWSMSIPFFSRYLTEIVITLLCVPATLLGGSLFGYLGLISRYLPSKPVGRCVKHGFELMALVAAFMTQWFWGYDAIDLQSYSAFVCLFHALFHLLQHPVDLGWLDFSLEELMQLGVYVCGNGIYAIVNLVLWNVVIGYRIYSYSYTQVSGQNGLPLLA